MLRCFYFMIIILKVYSSVFGMLAMGFYGFYYLSFVFVDLSVDVWVVGLVIRVGILGY